MQGLHQHQHQQQHQHHHQQRTTCRPRRQHAPPQQRLRSSLQVHASTTTSTTTSSSSSSEASSIPQHARRQLLLLAGSTAVAAAAAAGLRPPIALAASECQLQESAKTGLQWCDLTPGEGQLPIKGSFTKVHYTAKLASNGAVFDSTYQRRQPLIFKVGECEMVQAFDTAILGAEDIPPMREGGKRLVLARPGPMQRQGVKSLTWVTGLLDAIDEAGEPQKDEGGFNSDLLFELELMPKRRG